MMQNGRIKMPSIGRGTKPSSGGRGSRGRPPATSCHCYYGISGGQDAHHYNVPCAAVMDCYGEDAQRRATLVHRRPQGQAFHFQAQTGSGGINTDFEKELSFNKKGNQARGDVGSDPRWTVDVRTGSGNVRVCYRQ